MAFHTIKIKKYGDAVEEHKANAILYPGMLLEFNSNGNVQKHSHEDGNAFVMFALEDELQGGDILTAYVANAMVQCWIPGDGDIVYAQLKDGQNVVIGDFLTSAGDGTLQKYVRDNSSEYKMNPEQIVGMAAEAVNLASSSDGDTDAPGIAGNRFIKIRVM